VGSAAPWTPEQVLGLAPDESSARAGRGLATARKWTGLGQDERAVWGLCQGSGSKPYQTQVDLSEPAFKCSCPSRKFPCKHALGLLLLWSGGEVAAGAAPGWVEEWLASRGERAERAQQRAERAAARGDEPADPEAQARRAARREERVAAGADELRQWLRDLIRRGLADAQRRPYRFWEEAAARMVDAQANGLATRVRRLGGTVAGGGDWAGRALEQAALLHLLLEAHGRELGPELDAEVQGLLGRTVPQEEVLAGARVRDDWAVAGQVVVDDERLRVQRTWLLGTATRRPALVLSFAPPGQMLDTSLVVGTVVDAELAFYPGTAPLRALVAEWHDAPRALEELPAEATLDAALAARAELLARSPWLDRFPLAVREVVPVPGAALVDADGAALPLAPGFDAAWELVALSGGRPLAVFGELDGDRLTPLSALADGRLVAL
jgi:hypothetical protein